jgi:hypothetical protein
MGCPVRHRRYPSPIVQPAGHLWDAGHELILGPPAWEVSPSSATRLTAVSALDVGRSRAPILIDIGRLSLAYWSAWHSHHNIE